MTTSSWLTPRNSLSLVFALPVLPLTLSLPKRAKLLPRARLLPSNDNSHCECEGIDATTTVLTGGELSKIPMNKLLESFLRIFKKESADSTPAGQDQQPMKYLIVGLGNIGAEYQGTRHNIGFTILDALAEASNIVFTTQRYGAVAQMRLKNQQLVLLKPSTYMNLSGEAVRYWMNKEKIDLDHLLVIVDDIALPFGQIRIRPKGADGGHNGLKSINNLVGSQQWARLRFGVGNDFPPGGQVDYVLGYPTPEDLAILPARAKVAIDAIKAFCLSGVSFAMNNYNNK